MLGGPSGCSLMQLQLPRSLLEASSSMPWDAAAAACLQLLHSLLDAVHRSGSGSAGDGGQAAQQELLQRVFSPQLREAGALAATRICQMSRTLLRRASGGAWLGSAQRMLQLVRRWTCFVQRPCFGQLTGLLAGPCLQELGKSRMP